MKDRKNPEVAVVVTNYNYAMYLEQAIESVLAQTYDNIALFVIDDASTDGSSAILDKYKDDAKITRHKKNKGIVYARNEALDFVKSEYILFLDADDWLEPDYIQKLVELSEANKLDVAYCGMQYYIDGKKGMNWIPPEFNLERLKNENYIQMSSLIRTKSIAGIRFDKDMEKLTHEDWDFFLSLALKGLKFERVETTSLNYRYKSVSRNLTADADEKFANLYKYLYEKHSTEKPGEVGYLAYYRFVKSFLDVSNKLNESERISKDREAKLDLLSKELDAIRRSKSYKLGKILLMPLRLAKAVARKVRSVPYVSIVQDKIERSKISNTLKSAVYDFNNRNAATEGYFIDQDGPFHKTSSYAVVLHLYYTENWDEIFSKKLKLLSSKMEFDLYITMPESNRAFMEVILESFPQASCLVVPNKGRDVLPFIKAAALLKEMGYKKVLKIHSKKSTHRDNEGNTAEGGGQWLVNTLDALIPEDDTTLGLLLEKIKNEKTGIVGPYEYYYPLKIYLRKNLPTIERVMKHIDDNLFSGLISQKLDKMGFFGGTMFWVDISAIEDALSISEANFQPEKGQTDGTLAHALERVFSILPYIKGKDIYGVSTKEIVKLNDKESTYPEWYYDDISSGKPRISIIVPVYSDWSSLSKNIRSLKKLIGNYNDVSVYYVNDSGPEADVLERKITQGISGITNFYYFRNKENLGFVKTCNRAVFELVGKNDDVLLLNSDTKVTKNFVFEMKKVLYSDWNIGAVTSRSNNATIWSVPMNARLANYRWASYVLYRLIKRNLPDKYITPTIHGFCVLIRREVVAKYGMFDEIYGTGYAEENDFAMRLRKHGWKCAVANHSFVFHYESRSFGNEARNKQIEHNEKILLKRYPNYRQLVQEYWDSIKEPLK